MLDILERLKRTSVPCTCFSRSNNYLDHNDLCTHRIIREAEAEIDILRNLLEDDK